MDADTWATCYEKLRVAYRKEQDPEQAKLYFELLGNVPGPVMRLAVQKVITAEKFWPNPATLRDYCDDAHLNLMIPAHACDTCEGSTWVDTEPLIQWGKTYPQVKRCPTCYVQRGRIA